MPLGEKRLKEMIEWFKKSDDSDERQEFCDALFQSMGNEELAGYRGTPLRPEFRDALEKELKRRGLLQ